jgi:predicted dehydrogenase
MDRRDFLRAGAAAGTFLNLNPRARGANERVTLALIGGHNQGRGVATRAIKAGGFFKTFCDIDDAVLEKVGGEIETAQKRKPVFAKDYRRVLEDKDIDAVVIVTPDHWHTHIALLACQAGKDVYCEKPLSQTIREGHLMRDAARKYKRVFQVGTQRRSGEHFAAAAEYVASGKLGKVGLIKTWIHQLRPTIGRPADGSPPPGADYDMWLGPAPKRPFNENRFHYNWRFFWDYGNSEIGNQGVHVLDVAIWAIQKLRGMDRCLPTRISSIGGIFWLDDAKEVPDTQETTYHYDSLTLTFELRSFLRGGKGTDFMAAFYGTEGSLLLGNDKWEVTDAKGQPGPSMKSTGMLHEKNFLDCVKSRQRPNSDVEIGRLSTTLCHLGNISYKLGRDVKFDPKTETFPGDAQATALLTKSYRKEYPLPKV